MLMPASDKLKTTLEKNVFVSVSEKDFTSVKKALLSNKNVETFDWMPALSLQEKIRIKAFGTINSERIINQLFHESLILTSCSFP